MKNRQTGWRAINQLTNQQAEYTDFFLETLQIT